MSSAQERPSSRAGTAGPADSNTGTGAGDMADRGTSAGTGATGTGTTGYERAGAHRGPTYEETAYEGEVSPARAGGMMLAAVLMVFSGLVTFFDGIVGILNGTFFPTVSNYAFTIGPTGRGIVNMALGAVIFAAGVCLLLGMLWARIVGIVLAVFIGIYNFLILPWYPIWSIILVALNVYIIWALATAGRSRRVA
ncbi:MAG TPA: hypothetical protein VGR98_15795 [Streptosporangiaceae bacterium]|nr:hypothetical protein [Streptosporangiaceae bacterium]